MASANSRGHATRVDRRHTSRAARCTFDRHLATAYDIELIAPHNSTRRSKTQDGRPLRRRRRRWKIERLFAWLHNFRRVVTRWERYPDNFLGMIQLASAIILLRHL